MPIKINLPPELRAALVIALDLVAQQAVIRHEAGRHFSTLSKYVVNMIFLNNYFVKLRVDQPT